ncbi:MAG: hypothetical protein ACJ71P_01445 [Nitrososphaeraceae archaeon]
MIINDLQVLQSLAPAVKQQQKILSEVNKFDIELSLYFKEKHHRWPVYK